MKNRILLTALTALAIGFSGCGDSGTTTIGDFSGYDDSSSNTDKLTAQKNSNGFTIHWKKSQNQYSEVSYDKYEGYKRGEYIATSRSKGDYTITCHTSYANETEMSFSCDSNDPILVFSGVTLNKGKDYHFFVNAGQELNKGSTQFTIRYIGSGNITIK